MKHIVLTLLMCMLGVGFAQAQERPTVMPLTIGSWKIRCYPSVQDPRLDDCTATVMARAKSDPNFIVKLMVSLDDSGAMHTALSVPTPPDAWFEDTRLQHVVSIGTRRLEPFSNLSVVKGLCVERECIVTWPVLARELYDEDKERGYVVVTTPVDVGMSYDVHVPLKGFKQVHEALSDILERNRSIQNQGAE